MSSLAAAEPAAPPRLAAPAFGARLFAFVERGHAQACALLLLISLACFLPGFVSLQPMDRDEPRFAQASKQMLETGDLVDIRFQDEARHKKPVGIYWLQSASVAAAETLGFREAQGSIAAYRVPSLLGALATVFLTYWAGLAFLNRRGAFLAAALVAGSVILMVEARLAKTDAVLAACCTATLGGLARAYLARGAARLPRATLAAFWAGMALGILVKGPMVLLFAGLAAVVLSIRERSARWLLALEPKLGLAVTLLVVLPWFLAIAVKSGGAFYQASVGHDMLGKVGSAQTYHWAPPGFYFVSFFATFWPGAALAAIAAPLVWRHRRDDAFAFALAWIIPAYLLLEAVPTKLPHYALPLFPMVAIALALALDRGLVDRDRFGAKTVALLTPFIPAGLLVGLGVAAWNLDRTLPVAGLVALAVAAVVATMAWRRFVEGESAEALVTGVAASAILAFGVLGLVQPELRSLKVSPRLASAAKAAGCPAANTGTVGYREPSLVFLVGTELRMFENGRDAAVFAAGAPCRVVFVEARHEPAFLDALAAQGLTLEPRERVAGFNINGGRRVDLGVYVAGPGR